MVERRRRGPGARETIAGLPVLQEVLDAMAWACFRRTSRDRYRELVDELTGGDWFMVTADFDAYAETQRHGRGRAGAIGTPGGGRAC